MGWHQLDEADEHVDRPEAIPLVPSSAQTGRVTFLTLTNHFYSKASPFPNGPTLYPGSRGPGGDVGFDLYPLQNWCRLNKVGDVYDAQKELDALSNHKPTFQWIEVRVMDCRPAYLTPSPATVRAETWLAVAGGAAGSATSRTVAADVRAEMRGSGPRLRSPSPALLDEGGTAPVAEPSPVRVGVRRHNGAVYVIADQPHLCADSAKIAVAGLGTTGLRRYGDGHWVTACNGVLRDTFRGWR